MCFNGVWQVHSVKALFSEKEQSILADARRREADQEGEIRLALQAQAAAEDAAARARSRAEDAERSRREAEQALSDSRAERERLSEQLTSKVSEASAASEEKARVEAEMRLVLRAMDQQKAAASRNMNQLSKIYDEWSHAANI